MLYSKNTSDLVWVKNMGRVHKKVIAGKTREDFYFWTGRLGKKIKTNPAMKETTLKQLKQNENDSEKRLRWYINTNFTAGDWWLCLHLPPKTIITQEDARKLLDKFLREMRKQYKKKEKLCKYIYTAGIGKRGALHFHMICNHIEAQIIADAWQKFAGTEQYKYPSVDFQAMDRRENHQELASYIMKNSREIFYDTNRRIHSRRWCKSKNLQAPKIEYTTLKRNWNKNPKPSKGYYIQTIYDGMDFNGNIYRHIIQVRI